MVRYVITIRDRIRLNDRMKEVLETISEGFVQYKEGWSDEILARELGIPSAKAVGNHRLELFGKLTAVPNSNNELARVKAHLNALCNSLGFARLD